MKSGKLFASAAALLLMAVPADAIAAQATEKPGSAYLQCDGQPNNMTEGESAARLLGAVTLLGLFAPPPEAPDASKRKFAMDGVAACSSLIDGEKREGNAKRRLGLILGRAIHQFEAKNYQAALDDVALARREAVAAGIGNDPYFQRSRGRSFDRIESAALFRMGKIDEAQAASLRSASLFEYSLFGLLGVETQDDFLRNVSTGEDQVNLWRARMAPQLGRVRADRLELAGRFTESAQLRDAIVEFDAEETPDGNSSSYLAEAAITHALAGDGAAAASLAKAARENSDKRKADGKPEANAAEIVELLDLYNIIEIANGGDAKTARRLFSARSEWVSASLGSVLEVNRRLREGASADELIGGLALDSSEIWKKRADASRAAVLSKDADNKTLFYLISPTLAARDYEALTKDVWRTDKSKIVIDIKNKKNTSRMEFMFLPMTSPTIAMDGYVLHAALLAKSRGHQGFVFSPIVSDKYIAASFRTGNRGEKGFPSAFFIDANDAIAKLSPIIPDPNALKSRMATRNAR